LRISSELDAAAYGTAKMPIALTSTSSTGKERTPAACSTGTEIRSGARSTSPRISDRRAPSIATTDPPGMPSTNAGSVAQARTRPIFVVEPVVARTNHGSATVVMFVPISEMKRAMTTARSTSI